ncbi:hypothetical protein [Maritalea mediterranea]|uniref:Tail tubular protein B n=1 Tax=Maritalea mediterranea TaxID=2909667 RepID=A0ABS9EC65_9HYPH|nr:hypothetical protein [Maritalea mediterranea]MCF4099787.1 hypothetical protein [Maritalea mediterranea]
MASVSGAIPNLIGGVSQQPPEIRAINTAKELLNTCSSAATGLFTRPCGNYVGRIGASPTGNDTVAIHTINKPEGQYQITIHGGQVYVMDLVSGGLQPVTVEGGADAYINVENAAENLGFVTVADVTFIYNKSKTVTVSRYTESGLTGRNDDGQDRYNPNLHGTYWVMQRAGYMANYSVYMNNALQATVATDSLKPSEIATNLKTGLVGAGYTSDTVSDTVGYVEFSSETDFISTSDDYANQAIRSYNDKITEFTDLPNFDRAGRLVLVEQSKSDAQDDYWVWYHAGRWQETYGWGSYETLDAETMPVILLDNGDGTWTLRYHTWIGREVGDEDSNPTPTFVGNTINWMGLVKGRMVILSDENFIASRVGNFEAFYRSTCTQLLDDDPIDIADPKSRGATLNSLMWFDNALLAFSDGDQFRIEGDNEGLLSPNTVSIRKVNSYSNAPKVNPVSLGPNVVFVDDFSNGRYAQVMEYQIERLFGRQVALPITDAIPEYINSGVYKIIESPSNKTVMVMSSGDRSSMWVYNYYENQQGRVQSAWQKWKFHGQVYNAEFIQDELVVTLSYSGDLMVNRFHFVEGIDAVIDDDTILLDYKMDQSMVSVSFDGQDSTVTLPFEVATDDDLEDFIAVISLDNPVSMEAGQIKTAVSRSGNTVVFKGVNLTTENFYVGFRYEFYWYLNPIYMRDQNLVAIHDGRLQLRRLSLLFNDSGPFTSYTALPSRPVTHKRFTGFVLGSGDDLLNRFSLNSGEFKVPAYGQGEKVGVYIKAKTPWRVRFSSVEWDGSYRPLRRRTT